MAGDKVLVVLQLEEGEGKVSRRPIGRRQRRGTTLTGNGGGFTMRFRCGDCSPAPALGRGGRECKGCSGLA
jgi:hypothetical protein